MEGEIMRDLIHEHRGEGVRDLLLLGACLLAGYMAACARPGGAAPQPVSLWRESARHGYTLHYTAGHGADSREVARMVDRGSREVEGFFGAPFPRAFDLRIFPDRSSLTAYWREAWKTPDFESQCWMVASGTASTLAVLSPAVWKSEACEHDPADRPATRKLIAHELVHVYHGQVNPNPEFEGVDEIGWFVEGLAVLASGQLDEGRLGRARAAVVSGKGPARLQDAWSGPDRYGIAGSLVSFIDWTRGRATLLRLMRCTANRELLEALGLSEEELLSRWKADLTGGSGREPRS
jgi:hypothetical protein